MQRLLTIAQSGEINSVDSQLKSLMERGTNDQAAEEICEALAIGYLKTYRLREAWVILTYWAKWQPKALFPKIWRADICRRTQNGPAEEQEYRSILEIDPRQLSARRKLADVLKESNRIEAAAEEFEHCHAQDPSDADVLIGLIECRRRLRETSAAQSLLTRNRCWAWLFLPFNAPRLWSTGDRLKQMMVTGM